MTDVDAPPGWVAPGPGRWDLELAHFDGRFTPLYAAVYADGQNEGIADAFARYGLAAKALAIAFVNHRPYMRVTPLFEPPARMQGKAPPAAMVWLLSRLHPAFRRRNKAARRAWKAKEWEVDARRWAALKPEKVKAQLALQDEPIETLDDAGLANHVLRACSNVADGVRLHFELAVASGAPVGELIVACREWGVPDADALELLSGASPASSETAGWRSSDTADGYVRQFGHRMVTSYDVDGRTLVELPELLAASVQQLDDADAPDGPVLPHAVGVVRARVPVGEHSRFDELVHDARLGYGVRDDNAGVTLQWPVGLLRRAALEAGRRLVVSGRLDEPEHTFELQPAELASLLRGDAGPSRQEVAQRARTRAAENAADAPAFLGPEEPLPPFDRLPRPLRRMGVAMVASYELMNTAPQTEELCGTGVGARVVQGRARVAANADDAIRLLEPGDVLVARFTTPAFNAVLPVVGALVVEEGGALSHAAIVARELDIPSVIGVVGATTKIPDGAQVEVDPRAGRVRIV